MRIDFSGTELVNNAFSRKPMTFCDSSAKDALTAVLDLLAIETGSRAAREAWQHAQLVNLLLHSAARSPFWKRRIGAGRQKYVALQSLPILKRAELRAQVEKEGALLRREDGIAVTKHATSGSTGMPTEFFVSGMNIEFNNVRNIAQYFAEGRDLKRNKTILKHSPELSESRIQSRKSGSWLAPMDAMFQSGCTRMIEYFHPDAGALRTELTKEAIGYLVSSPRIIETLLQDGDAEFLAAGGAHMWIPIGEAVNPAVREALLSCGVTVRSTYSAEEVGVIGSECERHPDTFHIATSNVIVEIDDSERVRVGDEILGRVLVTHLHSYATPFIRYDIGDLASMAQRCPCGHDGPILTNVHGRTKSLIKLPDGRVAPFYVRNIELQAILDFSEYRIRQVDLGRMLIEIGTHKPVSAEQLSAIVELMRTHSLDVFDIDVRIVEAIDWGDDRKRLGYHSAFV